MEEKVRIEQTRNNPIFQKIISEFPRFTIEDFHALQDNFPDEWAIIGAPMAIIWPKKEYLKAMLSIQEIFRSLGMIVSFEKKDPGEEIRIPGPSIREAWDSVRQTPNISVQACPPGSGCGLNPPMTDLSERVKNPIGYMENTFYRDIDGRERLPARPIYCQKCGRSHPLIWQCEPANKWEKIETVEKEGIVRIPTHRAPSLRIPEAVENSEIQFPVNSDCYLNFAALNEQLDQLLRAYDETYHLLVKHLRIHDKLNRFHRMRRDAQPLREFPRERCQCDFCRTERELKDHSHLDLI